MSMVQLKLNALAEVSARCEEPLAFYERCYRGLAWTENLPTTVTIPLRGEY